MKIIQRGIATLGSPVKQSFGWNKRLGMSNGAAINMQKGVMHSGGVRPGQRIKRGQGWRSPLVQRGGSAAPLPTPIPTPRPALPVRNKANAGSPAPYRLPGYSPVGQLPSVRPRPVASGGSMRGIRR